MADKQVIRVNAERYKQINAYAKERGVTVTEAAESMIGTAAVRLAALAKYAQKQKKGSKKSKPAKKAKAKAPKGARKSKPRAKKTTAAPAESSAPVAEGTEPTST